MKSRVLRGGPWEKLFPRALTLIDEISRYGGIADPFWTLGGGTVLMFRYHHRLSKDIDIFVPDPQYLGFVTPRLSDTAADLTQDYTEQPGAFVKLQFEEGEVDFVAAPNLLDDAWETWDIGGRCGRRSDPAAACRIARRFRRHRYAGLQAGIRPLRDRGWGVPGQHLVSGQPDIYLPSALCCALIPGATPKRCSTFPSSFPKSGSLPITQAAPTAPAWNTRPPCGRSQ